MVQVPSHVVCFFPLLSDHQETFSLWSGFIIASGFDGAYGQMSPAFCVCVTDEQQCCEPHGSQQHLTGSERIRKTHQLHPRAAEHDVSRSDFYPSTCFTLTVHPGAEELLILQPLNITTELACSAQHKHISGFLFSNTRTRITHPFMRSFWCIFYSTRYRDDWEFKRNQLFRICGYVRCEKSSHCSPNLSVSDASNFLHHREAN